MWIGIDRNAILQYPDKRKPAVYSFILIWSSDAIKNTNTNCDGKCVRVYQEFQSQRKSPRRYLAEPIFECLATSLPS